MKEEKKERWRDRSRCRETETDTETGRVHDIDSAGQRAMQRRTKCRTEKMQCV